MQKANGKIERPEAGFFTFAFCLLTCSFSPTEQVKSQNAKGKWQN
jgi:hypothetical protein